jgi:hypothetical protein
MFLDGGLVNDIGSARSNVLANILSNLQTIKMFLRYRRSCFHTKVSYYLTVMSFPNQLCMLS